VVATVKKNMIHGIISFNPRERREKIVSVYLFSSPPSLPNATRLPALCLSLSQRYGNKREYPASPDYMIVDFIKCVSGSKRNATNRESKTIPPTTTTMTMKNASSSHFLFRQAQASPSHSTSRIHRKPVLHLSIRQPRRDDALLLCSRIKM